MKNILQFFLVISISLTPFYVFSSERLNNRKSILSFTVWKAQKIQSAQEQIRINKQKIHDLKRLQGNKKSKELGQLNQQLNQNQFNLEVTRNLGITDYLALYLSTYQHNTAIHKAAQQMTPQEVSLVLKAYLSSIKGNEGTGGIEKLKLPRYSKDSIE